MSEEIGERALALGAEADTVALAEDLALLLAPGVALLLSGDLGAGKTALARALLRALHDDPALEVPSPTFTLMQPYEAARLPVAHVDLYRVESPEEVEELDLGGFLERGALIVEWPEHGDLEPGPGRPLVAIDFGEAETARAVRIVAEETFLARFDRIRAGRAFLREAGFGRAERRFLQGDASTRRFERVRRPGGGASAVLMDAPARPDGPPVQSGMSYARLARLAEDVRPFLAVGAFLRQAGLSAPAILARDEAAGFLLCEDLGAEKIAAGGAPVPERYLAAADVLARLHDRPVPADLPLPDGANWRLPAFDLSVFRVELSLFLDWYLPSIGAELSLAERQGFDEVWRGLLERALGDERHLVLRDYHSPNLMWLPEREGPARVGLIDHQDAVVGPIAYDLASLGQDARVTVPTELEAAILARYAEGRRAAGASLDETRLGETYAILSAQRALRILGTFTRLDRRDGKSWYLAHVPRLQGYLARSLAHPSLVPLRDWFAARGEATLRAFGHFAGAPADGAPADVDPPGAKRT